jgi:CheY-like chemotaxis protein
VIIITSSDSPQDRSRANELGASFYFRKPADLQSFMKIGQIVGDFLDKRISPVPR